jgi:hypothetical protein
VIARQILMGVLDRLLVMSWTPDHDADHQHYLPRQRGQQTTP